MVIVLLICCFSVLFVFFGFFFCFCVLAFVGLIFLLTLRFCLFALLFAFLLLFALVLAFVCCRCLCSHRVVKKKGLADAYIKMRLPFESDEAAKLNRDIFETIYFGAVNASVEVKKKKEKKGGMGRLGPLLPVYHCENHPITVLFIVHLQVGWPVLRG